MTIGECYDSFGGDYEEVLERMMGSEAMVQKFAIKFLKDGSFQNLTKSLKDKEWNEAFRAVHTLKGVAQNLGFTDLFKVSSELCEYLRAGNTEGYEALYENVKNEYERTVEGLNMLKTG